MNAYEICAAVLKLEIDRDAAQAAWPPKPDAWQQHTHDKLANATQHICDLQNHATKDKKEIRALRAAEDDNLRAIENWRNDLDNRTMQLEDVQAKLTIVREQVASLRALIGKYGSQVLLDAARLL